MRKEKMNNISKHAEKVLKSKLDAKIMILNNPDYTFNKIIEAMIEFGEQMCDLQKLECSKNANFFHAERLGEFDKLPILYCKNICEI